MRLSAVPQRMRTTRFGIVVIAVVMLVSTGFVVAGLLHPRAPDSQAEVDRVGERLDAARPWDPRTEPADGGSVEVLEQAFTRVPAVRDGTGHRYAIGFVLENTSRTDAVIPDIDITVLDENGDRITGTAAVGELDNETIPPGFRAGFGEYLQLDHALNPTVSVSVGRSQWYPARADIGTVTTTRITPDDSTGLTVEFDSDYDTALLSPTVYLLFRDTDGGLLGGRPTYGEGMGGAVPPGKSRHVFALDPPAPKGSDLAATEVYVSHDGTVIGF